MRFGIHLPQYGHASGSDPIRLAARQAEDLGFDDVWVSDHQAIPVDQGYPPPYLFDPLTTLTWAGAVTERVGLGTSVLVLPQHETVSIANTIASLDALTGGRVILGVGVGWSAAEFAALHQDFTTRGRRMDEQIRALRSLWESDPTTFSGEFHNLIGLRLLPKPHRRVPIWIGGGVEASWRRAVQLGDGFHALGLDVEQMERLVIRLRRDRPDPDDFTISLRVGWDGLRDDLDELARLVEQYAAVGVQHLMSAPAQADIDGWLRSVERLAKVFDRFR